MRSILLTPSLKKQARVHMRAACFQDYAQIAALESRHELDIKSYDDWSHLWWGNPTYHELQTDWPIGWVLENADQQIVGSIGNIPLLYELAGKRVLAASGRGWVAEPAYRSMSLILLDHLVNQPGVDLYLNNTVGVNSLASVIAFECLRVPVGRWDEAGFWITDHRGLSRSLLFKGNQPLKSLSHPLSVATLLKTLISRKPLPCRDVEVQTCAMFDDRFDDFWARLKGKNPGLLLAVRTREVLQWHFRAAHQKNQLWIATVPDGPRLAAYAVFDRKDNRSTGVQRTRLVDFQSIEGSTDLLAPILSWALRKCLAEGIHVLECTGRWLEKGEFVQTFAPYRRKLPNWTYFYRANHPGLAERLRDRRA